MKVKGVSMKASSLATILAAVAASSAFAEAPEWKVNPATGRDMNPQLHGPLNPGPQTLYAPASGGATPAPQAERADPAQLNSTAGWKNGVYDIEQADRERH
jgi:hypothetical protein